MKKSSMRSCAFDGALAIPMKSRTTAFPSAAPWVACVQNVAALRNMRSRKKNRSERVESKSLGLVHWYWDSMRRTNVQIAGERKKDSVCSW